MNMRRPTERETKIYRYIVEFKIDVKRTDGAMLTPEENVMVQEMRDATEAAIAKAMADHGHPQKKHLGSKLEAY